MENWFTLRTFAWQFSGKFHIVQQRTEVCILDIWTQTQSASPLYPFRAMSTVLPLYNMSHKELLPMWPELQLLLSLLFPPRVYKKEKKPLFKYDPCVEYFLSCSLTISVGNFGQYLVCYNYQEFDKLRKKYEDI